MKSELLFGFKIETSDSLCVYVVVCMNGILETRVCLGGKAYSMAGQQTNKNTDLGGVRVGGSSGRLFRHCCDFGIGWNKPPLESADRAPLFPIL